MKKLLIGLCICVLWPFFGMGSAMLRAQEQAQADTIVPLPVHVDIFTLLRTPNSAGYTVMLHQSPDIKEVMNGYIVRNPSKKTPGFRVRLFFDNSQTARRRAIEIESKFKAQYPEVRSYLSYQNLYFKVAVGDFRTRTDAMRFLQSISSNYPGAFIIKENINYPAL